MSQRRARTQRSGMTTKLLTRTGSVGSVWLVKRAHCTGRPHFPLDTIEVGIRISSAVCALADCARHLCNIAFQGQPSRQPGNLTPRTMNSLSAIAGHEGDEEDWEREMRGLQNEEEVCSYGLVTFIFLKLIVIFAGGCG